MRLAHGEVGDAGVGGDDFDRTTNRKDGHDLRRSDPFRAEHDIHERAGHEGQADAGREGKRHGDAHDLGEKLAERVVTVLRQARQPWKHGPVDGRTQLCRRQAGELGSNRVVAQRA